jgi:hypothetical protein
MSSNIFCCLGRGGIVGHTYMGQRLVRIATLQEFDENADSLLPHVAIDGSHYTTFLHNSSGF